MPAGRPGAFGLQALHQANARAEAMVRDQERIAFFNDIFASIANLNVHTIGMFVPEKSANMARDGSLFSTPTSTIPDLTALIEREMAIGGRRFGREGMPDEPEIARLRADLQAIKPAAIEVGRLGREQSVESAAQFGLENLLEPLQAMQRDAYTIVQQIEGEMRDPARTTAQDYLSSRQNILSAALIAVGIALLLGYSISSSLLWPIGRIRHALGTLSGGGFDTRITVPNRDELGELAGHVNQTSEKLGDLYKEVEAQKAQLTDWNAALETRVNDQVEVIERANRLKRFLPLQVADMIVGAPDEAEALATKRAEITVLFADLRGFTAFSTAAKPDQVVAALNTFHGACGPLVEKSGGTLERFLGDGLMVLFGAPLPMDDAAQRAVNLAVEMREAVSLAIAPFQAGADARALGVGIGVGTGAATLGQIGFEGRLDYSAIGPAPNLAARLCDMAADGQILISHATAWQIEAEMEPVGPFDLKGIGSNVAAFELTTTNKKQ